VNTKVKVFYRKTLIIHQPSQKKITHSLLVLKRSIWQTNVICSAQLKASHISQIYFSLYHIHLKKIITIPKIICTVKQFSLYTLKHNYSISPFWATPTSHCRRAGLGRSRSCEWWILSGVKGGSTRDVCAVRRSTYLQSGFFVVFPDSRLLVISHKFVWNSHKLV
jgi:hypothetical protein